MKRTEKQRLFKLHTLKGDGVLCKALMALKMKREKRTIMMGRRPRPRRRRRRMGKRRMKRRRRRSRRKRRRRRRIGIERGAPFWFGGEAAEEVRVVQEYVLGFSQWLE